MLPSSSVYDGLRGAAVEWAWFLTHWALYPLGVAAEAAPASPGRLDTGSAPVSPPESEGVGRPVLLVHGWGDNRAVFTLLRRSLQRAGFPQVLTTDYSPLTCDVREAALRLGEQVETVCRRTGYDRLHVVGHSLGGIITRYYVQRLGGDERVHTLVTLGSPHAGTAAGWWLPHPLVRQLQPGSGLIRELSEPAPAAGPASSRSGATSTPSSCPPPPPRCTTRT